MKKVDISSSAGTNVDSSTNVQGSQVSQPIANEMLGEGGKNKLPGFQRYLVEKGFKRTCTEHCGTKEKEDYESTFLSTYNPLYYNFKKGEKYCYWGLSEWKKPPVMCLGIEKMYIVQNRDNYRTFEDGYRILFSEWDEDRFDEIYHVLMAENEYFKINVEDGKNINIEILER